MFPYKVNNSTVCSQRHKPISQPDSVCPCLHKPWPSELPDLSDTKHLIRSIRPDQIIRIDNKDQATMFLFFPFLLLFIAATENVFLTNASLVVLIICCWVQHSKHSLTLVDVLVKADQCHTSSAVKSLFHRKSTKKCAFFFLTTHVWAWWALS